ncbi:MAG: hypothetical protein MI747_21520 [Desulfobacterales bacterium]|nr:hypothetical protein [Desulfobacterales bacterium]
MVKARVCNFQGKKINIEKAIKTRESTKLSERKLLFFSCTECGERVRAHKAGPSMAAHFEHFKGNANCSLSDHRK